MSKNIIRYTLLFVIMVLAQAIVFNHLCLFNVAVPFVFLYFILSLPINLKTNTVLTLSFLIGLTVDIFADTQGMNALACTVTGALRHPVLKLYVQRDDDLGDREPSTSSMGIAAYIKFVLTITFIYCTLFFALEAMTFSHIGLMIARIGASTLLTSLLIMATNSVRPRR